MGVKYYERSSNLKIPSIYKTLNSNTGTEYRQVQYLDFIIFTDYKYSKRPLFTKNNSLQGPLKHTASTPILSPNTVFIIHHIMTKTKPSTVDLK